MCFCQLRKQAALLLRNQQRMSAPLYIRALFPCSLSRHRRVSGTVCAGADEQLSFLVHPHPPVSGRSGTLHRCVPKRIRQRGCACSQMYACERRLRTRDCRLRCRRLGVWKYPEKKRTEATLFSLVMRVTSLHRLRRLLCNESSGSLHGDRAKREKSARIFGAQHQCVFILA